MKFIRNLFSGRYRGSNGPIPLGDPKNSTKYCANKIHREYAFRLYKKIDRSLGIRYPKGSILQGVTIQDIEFEARRVEDRYEVIGRRIIEKVEQLLDIKLSYYDRAAILMLQAEYEYKKPLFSGERGYILIGEYERLFGWEAIDDTAEEYFWGNYTDMRCLVYDDDLNCSVVIKHNVAPRGLGCGSSSGSGLFMPGLLSWSPWVDEYCEFPPGTTVKEIEEINGIKEKRQKMRESSSK